jgi:hypothetical protein
MINEVTISKAEYDELRGAKITMDLYRKAVIKTTKYSEWRHNPAMDDEDFLELVSLFDQNLIDDINRRCEKQKAELEKIKAADLVAKEGES